DLIKAYTKNKESAETKYKALSAADQQKPDGVALKAEIDDYIAKIDKAEKAIVIATANASNKPAVGGGALDPASVKIVTDAV
ncbi:hypothetical protein, partial [Vibrio vulnificus]|uniref:hypothetical protein n=1 Tax=Vibrio vulnificus TaxID=672 RepID=UPI0039B49E95